ncbi:MAG: segregation/condensation protein A [Oscillospiraceae bacterium]|nr:segregation/condensation protein A [Oscillospiraceae bacterium]
MEAPHYKLEAFEGPMDLLLSLIGQRKVSIHDVPILSLIEQYLEIVGKMREAQLELTAEFLEMAARLVYIKTAALLPKHEEVQDLAEELRQELLAYHDCQQLAGELRRRAKGFGFFARQPVVLAADVRYQRLHQPSELKDACVAALGKGKRRLPPPAEAFSGIVSHVIISVVSKYAFVFDWLRAHRQAPLSAMLETARSRSEIVATFLAVLSLVKAKRVAVLGSGADVVLTLQTKKEEWREIEQE